MAELVSTPKLGLSGASDAVITSTISIFLIADLTIWMEVGRSLTKRMRFGTAGGEAGGETADMVLDIAIFDKMVLLRFARELGERGVAGGLADKQPGIDTIPDWACSRPGEYGGEPPGHGLIPID